MIETIAQVIHERLVQGSEAALERFRAAVKPIYGSTGSGEPEHIGTALLLQLREGHFLLTAAHVIDWNDKTTLYLGEAGFEKLEGEAFISLAPKGDRNLDRADFALMPLDEEFVARLSAAKFVRESEISASVAETTGRTYVCLGYPNSKNKFNRHKGSVRPALGIYSSLGRPSSELPEVAIESAHVLVDFNSKYSRDDSGARIRSTALPGFSGGAIIDLGRISKDTLNSPFDPKLAALLIEGHRDQKVILGTRISVILASFRAGRGAT
jgi:hypothetical protein